MIEALQDERTWSALLISLRVAGLAVAAMLPVGVLVAWWLARSTSRWTSLVEALVNLPLVLPPVVVGLSLIHI